MGSSRMVMWIALACVAGCKTPPPAPPPPVPKLPNYAGMAEQVVSWLPEEGCAVALAYMDLSQVEAVQGKRAAEQIRSTYPDRMDVYLANSARAVYRQARAITVVDRRNMTHFLAEQKLQTSDMVPFDPESRVKLKKVRAVNTYVYWKIVREGDIEEWVLRAVAVETGEVYGGLVHRFRLPEELKVQPQVGDLTVESFRSTKDEEKFRLALLGNAAAMVHVGRLLERGHVNKAHLHDPEPWYRKAGEAGHAEGFYRAGLLYYGQRKRGNRKVKNWATARAWFEKAGALGHVKALTKLGWMHFKGEGTPIDLKRAREYYLKGAQGGDRVAMNQIGYLLANGQGGDVDLKGGAHWYQQAAENGSGVAASNLGHLYAGGRGVKKDDLAAVRWYRKSAWANYGPGMTALALMYERGRGVPVNLHKASDWLAKAKRNGCRAAHDHYERVSRALRAQKAKRRKAADERLARIRATPWVVIPQRLHIRVGRSTVTRIVATLTQGERLHVLEQESHVWRVLYRGQEGWVRAGMLRQLDPKVSK